MIHLSGFIVGKSMISFKKILHSYIFRKKNLVYLGSFAPFVDFYFLVLFIGKGFISRRKSCHKLQIRNFKLFIKFSLLCHMLNSSLSMNCMFVCPCSKASVCLPDNIILSILLYILVCAREKVELRVGIGKGGWNEWNSIYKHIP